MAKVELKSVLLLDGIDNICSEKLTKAGISVTIKPKLSKEELIEEIKNYDAVVVRSATKVTDEVLAAAGGRLKLVGRAGTGTDNIDLEAATERGIMVMNTPSGNTISAAEHTCALILSLSRFVPMACASLKRGEWERKKFLGSELYGKTLGIVGLGKIGKEVASRMKAFGMTIIGFDPVVSVAEAAEFNIESVALRALWPRSDYITVHTPLLPQTRHLLDRQVLLSDCKRGVKIVNVARGGIVDEAALLEALESERCGGAGLDVFVNEPPTDSPLCKHPKVVCTPHLGASTVEAQQRVAEEIAEQFIAASRDGTLTGMVNARECVLAASKEAVPWIDLAVALGKLAAAISGDIKRVDVITECYGVPSSLSQAVTSAVAVGMSADEAVNLVNAKVRAAAAGINVKDSTVGCTVRPILLPAGLPGGIHLTVDFGDGTSRLLGSEANGVPVLHAIDDCKWRPCLPLCGNVLLYRASLPVKPWGAAIVDISTRLVASGATVASIASSLPGDKSVWYAVGVLHKADKVEVAGLELIGQLFF